MNSPLTPTLDRVQDKLPPVASQVFRLNRTVAGLTYSAIAGVSHQLVSVIGDVTGRGRTGVETVKGQASTATERTVTTVKRGAAQVRGQATGEAKATATTAKKSAEEAVRDAADAVEGAHAGALDTLTKAELYDRAQELDIDGRSTMSKDELIDAIRSA